MQARLELYLAPAAATRQMTLRTSSATRNAPAHEAEMAKAVSSGVPRKTSMGAKDGLTGFAEAFAMPVL